MKATDFDLSKDLIFNPVTGITQFKNSRLVLFDSSAIGLLRETVIREMGKDKAREIFLQFGYKNGYADFLQMKLAFEFDNEMDLLASGPVIHTYEGIVQATPKEIRFARDSGEFYFTGVWTNSYEAEQHLSYHDVADEPVCWSIMGYASGWCTAFFGAPLIAIEPKCIGKGDDCCEWLIQPPDKFGVDVEPYRQAYRDFFEKEKCNG
ncbi:MAG: XylR N-terminal domain-containing protein [Deltaproteobacteria bacterium]|nr:XylR N-terminal domain-containing protein [Deltaproteobacteria bacterium]